MPTSPLSPQPLPAERRSTCQAPAARLVTMLALVVSPFIAGAQVARTRHLAAATTPRAKVVTVEARDFSFVMPAAIPAGLTTFRLRNHGKQAHHLSIVRMDSGKTGSDGIAALINAGHGVRPSWMHPRRRTERNVAQRRSCGHARAGAGKIPGVLRGPGARSRPALT